MSVQPDVQPRWRPEDWDPSEADYGTALQTVKGAIGCTCRGQRHLAIGCLERARSQMPDGTLAGMAVMFGAFLLTHPGMPERFWALREAIETWQLTEQQRAIFAEALGLMSAFADRDATPRDQLCGSSTIPPLRICSAVITIAAEMLGPDGEAWLEDFEWTLIGLWGPGPYGNGGETQ
jgi:hypothetical protein